MNEMMKRRNKLEIALTILQLCHSPQCSTHLMYKANLNYEQSKNILNELLEKSMLEKVEGKYFSTNFGLNFALRLEVLLGIWHVDKQLAQYAEVE